MAFMQPSIAISKATQASKLDRRAVLQHIQRKPALSILSSTSSQQGFSTVEYPDPPLAQPDEAYVQCPYCLEPLPAVEMLKGTKDEFWK